MTSRSGLRISLEKSFADSFYEAEEALLSKKALKSFTTLTGLN